MVMFGAMYYVVPRLTGREWVSAFLIRVHFWSCALGIALYFISLSVGGWLQGTSLLNADIPFIRVVLETLPYLWSRTAGGILMTIGHLAFALLYLLNMMGAGASRRGETMFRQEFVREPALASGEIDR